MKAMIQRENGTMLNITELKTQKIRDFRLPDTYRIILRPKRAFLEYCGYILCIIHFVWNSKGIFKETPLFMQSKVNSLVVYLWKFAWTLRLIVRTSYKNFEVPSFGKVAIHVSEIFICPYEIGTLCVRGMWSSIVTSHVEDLWKFAKWTNHL
jgi:hypothetical protein